MARNRGFDEETAVRAARDVFWGNGFGLTSLSRLEEATGLSRSSLYATYGSMRGLFERAARSYLSEVMGPVLAPMERPHPGRAELVRTFRQRIRAAILRCLLTVDGVPNPELTADVLSAGQAGLMVTARLDPQQAVEIAEAIAADIRSW